MDKKFKEPMDKIIKDLSKEKQGIKDFLDHLKDFDGEELYEFYSNFDSEKLLEALESEDFSDLLNDYNIQVIKENKTQVINDISFDNIFTEEEILLGTNRISSMFNINDEIKKLLVIAIETNDVNSDASRELGRLHKELTCNMLFGPYTIERHKELAKLSIITGPQKTLYNEIVEGGAQFLYDCVIAYLDSLE